MHLGRSIQRAKQKQRYLPRSLLHSTDQLQVPTTELVQGFLDPQVAEGTAVDLQDDIFWNEQLTLRAGDIQMMHDKTHSFLIFDKRVKPQIATPDDELMFYEMSKQLSIPKRPKWSATMTAVQLQELEQKSFMVWRRSLAQVEEDQKIILTPFEKNINIWRQLWRVVERSDLILIILDSRNPLMFRNHDLELYIRSMRDRTGKPKQFVLFLNKADLLTVSQRIAWSKFFLQEKVLFVWFSAVESLLVLEAEAKAKKLEESNVDEYDSELENILGESGDDVVIKKEEKKKGSAVAFDEPAAAAVPKKSRDPTDPKNYPTFKKKETKKKDAKLPETSASSASSSDDIDELAKKSSKVLTRDEVLDHLHKLAEVIIANKLKSKATPQQLTKKVNKPKKLTMGPIVKPEDEASLAKKTHDELTHEQFLEKLAAGDKREPGDETSQLLNFGGIIVGLVGYPNVGKSCTINCLLAMKKVIVSATPGKTKHFQTLKLDPLVTLCDCPGLVFPSFASTREGMLLDGILSIDHMRDPHPPMHLLLSRIPKEVFEMCYHLDLEFDTDVDESANMGELILNYYSRQKGYMTEHNKPNMSRAAREILKDYVNGKLLYVHLPPGISWKNNGEDEVGNNGEDDDEDYETEEEEEILQKPALPLPILNKDETLFNRDNVNMGAIYEKMIPKKAHKKKGNKHILTQDHKESKLELDENGELSRTVNVEDSDQIVEVNNNSSIINAKVKQITKRMRRQEERAAFHQSTVGFQTVQI